MASVRDELIGKIKVLNEQIWERQADWPMIEEWLDNFAADVPGSESERLHALFLLSQFMYYGRREMRELLRSLFRDRVKYPIIEAIRRRNGDTTDATFLTEEFARELGSTRFLGVGNPSESGTHLLYYFRQENQLHRNLFIHTHEIFVGVTQLGRRELA